MSHILLRQNEIMFEVQTRHSYKHETISPFEM